MLKKRIKETLLSMKLNKEAMQAELGKMMVNKEKPRYIKQKEIDIQMISACIAYAELLLKTGR